MVRPARALRDHLPATLAQALATKNRITNHRPTGLTGAADLGGKAGMAGVQSPAVFSETGTPVPAGLLRRIACDSQVTRIVFGPDSQILDVGRARRTVTGQLRRAVIARAVTGT